MNVESRQNGKGPDWNEQEMGYLLSGKKEDHQHFSEESWVFKCSMTLV